MAEAFPDNVPDDPDEVVLGSQEKPISVLLLATKWQFDTYGLSTVNKSLVNNLRVVDPEGKKIKITCAVVEEEQNIKDDQKEDAERHKVRLKGAKQPRGQKMKPHVEWLDKYTGSYYLDLVRENSFDFIIGHVPYLGNGCLNLRDMYTARENRPKVALVIHEIPRTAVGDTDEDLLLDWLSEADVTFSVGKAVESEIFSFITALTTEQQPTHKLYIPGFPLELFHVHPDTKEEDKVRGTQNVTVMMREQNDSEINGLDFALAVTSTAEASKHIQDFERVKTSFVMLTDNQEGKEQWKKQFFEVLQKEEFKGKSLQFRPDAPETVEKLKTHLRKSNLFILPLKPDSPLFGAEVLSAVAAGIPILVSNHSGIASVLETMCQDESIVKESALQPDAKTWKEAIIMKLVKPEEAKRAATTLREQLLLDTSIAQTHLDFTKTIIGKKISLQF